MLTLNRSYTHSRRGFSLVELIAVMVVLAILAAVAAPKFFNYSDDAKSAALQGSLGGVRTAIASFYANTSISGTALYPTFVEIRTAGKVMQETLPPNPYNGLSEVQRVLTLTEATARTVTNSARFGWNYYFDNKATPPVAIFWANSRDITAVSTGANANGGTRAKKANEL